MIVNAKCRRRLWESGRAQLGSSPLTVWETHGKLMLPGGKGAFSPCAADQLVWGIG